MATGRQRKLGAFENKIFDIVKIDSEYRYMRTFLGIGVQRCHGCCGANVMEKRRNSGENDTLFGVRTKMISQHLKPREEAASVMMSFQSQSLLQYGNGGTEVVGMDVAKTLI